MSGIPSRSLQCLNRAAGPEGMAIHAQPEGDKMNTDTDGHPVQTVNKIWEHCKLSAYFMIVSPLCSDLISRVDKKRMKRKLKHSIAQIPNSTVLMFKCLK